MKVICANTIHGVSADLQQVIVTAPDARLIMTPPNDLNVLGPYPAQAFGQLRRREYLFKCKGVSLRLEINTDSGTLDLVGQRQSEVTRHHLGELAASMANDPDFHRIVDDANIVLLPGELPCR